MIDKNCLLTIFFLMFALIHPMLWSIDFPCQEKYRNIVQKAKEKCKKS